MKLSKTLKIIIPLTLLTVLSVLVFSIYFYSTHLFPNTFIAGVNISNLTPEQAANKFDGHSKKDDNFMLTIDGNLHLIDLNKLGATLDPYSSANEILAKQKQKNIFNFFTTLADTLRKENHYPAMVKLDNDLLSETLQVLITESLTTAQKPSASLVNGVIIIENGTTGQDINGPTVSKQVIEALSYNKKELSITSQQIDFSLTDEELSLFKEQLEQIKNAKISFNTQGSTKELDSEKIVSLFTYPFAPYQQKVDQLIEDVDKQISRPPQNPVFKMANNKVVEFVPASDGLVVDKDDLKHQLINALNNLTTNQIASVDVKVVVTPPDYKTSDVNDLGIQTLLARGSSLFKGSIASRMHNIELGASKFNGVLIAPGEIFSFNSTIGDISTLTGYKQSYVILNGATVPGDGGGVCQVSTTLFRAALNAGLPIVERRSHSYRVGYYEQDAKPGLDATVYSPTTDFKFKNDTPGHLLVQTFFNPSEARLEFEIYGTDDGRKVEISEPVITSNTPPPEDLFIDDPTLPMGSVKQIDYKAWGAKSEFTYKVTRGDEVLQDKVFYSNYRPWQAKFLRGTGPTT